MSQLNEQGKQDNADSLCSGSNEIAEEQESIIPQWREAHRKPPLKMMSQTEFSMDEFLKDVDSMNKTPNCSSSGVSQRNTAEKRNNSTLIENGAKAGEKIGSLISYFNFSDETSLQLPATDNEDCSDDSNATWSFMRPERTLDDLRDRKKLNNSIDTSSNEPKLYSRCLSRSGFQESTILSDEESITMADFSSDSFNVTSTIPALCCDPKDTHLECIVETNEMVESQENSYEAVDSMASSLEKKNEKDFDTNSTASSGKNQQNEKKDSDCRTTSSKPDRMKSHKSIEEEADDGGDQVGCRMDSGEVSQSDPYVENFGDTKQMDELKGKVEKMEEKADSDKRSLEDKKTKKSKVKKGDEANSEKTSTEPVIEKRVTRSMTRGMRSGSQPEKEKEKENAASKKSSKTPKTTKRKADPSNTDEEEEIKIEKRITRSMTSQKLVEAATAIPTKNTRGRKKLPKAEKMKEAELPPATTEKKQPDSFFPETKIKKQRRKTISVTQATQTDDSGELFPIRIEESKTDSEEPRSVEVHESDNVAFNDSIAIDTEKENETMTRPGNDNESSLSETVLNDFGTPYIPRKAGHKKKTSLEKEQNYERVKPVALEIVTERIFTPILKKRKEVRTIEAGPCSINFEDEANIEVETLPREDNFEIPKILSECSTFHKEEISKKAQQLDSPSPLKMKTKSLPPSEHEKTFDLFGSSFVERDDWRERMSLGQKNIAINPSESMLVERNARKQKEEPIMTSTPRGCVLTSPVQIRTNYAKILKRKSQAMIGGEETNETDVLGKHRRDEDDWRETIGVTNTDPAFFSIRKINENETNEALAKRLHEEDSHQFVRSLDKSIPLTANYFTSKRTPVCAEESLDPIPIDSLSLTVIAPNNCSTNKTEKTFDLFGSSFVESEEWKEKMALSMNVSSDQGDMLDESCETFTVGDTTECKGVEMEESAVENDAMIPFPKLGYADRFNQPEPDAHELSISTRSEKKYNQHRVFIDENDALVPTGGDSDSDFEQEFPEFSSLSDDMAIDNSKSEIEELQAQFQERLTESFYQDFWRQLVKSKKKKCRLQLTMILEEDEPTYISVGPSEDDMMSPQLSFSFSSAADNATIIINVTATKSSKKSSKENEQSAEKAHLPIINMLQRKISRPDISYSFVQNEIENLKNKTMESKFIPNPFSISPILDSTITVDITGRKNSLMLTGFDDTLNDGFDFSNNSSRLSENNRTHTITRNTDLKCDSQYDVDDSNKKNNTNNSEHLRSTFIVSPALNNTVTVNVPKISSLMSRIDENERGEQDCHTVDETIEMSSITTRSDETYDPSKISSNDEEDYELKDIPGNLKFNHQLSAISPILENTVVVENSRRRSMMMSYLEEDVDDRSACLPDIAMIENETYTKIESPDARKAEKTVNYEVSQSNAILNPLNISPILDHTIILDVTTKKPQSTVTAGNSVSEQNLIRTPRLVPSSNELDSFDDESVRECLSAKSLKMLDAACHTPVNYSKPVNRAIIFDLDDCDSSTYNSSTSRSEHDSEDSVHCLDDLGALSKLVSRSPFVSSPPQSVCTPSKKKSIVWNRELESYQKLGRNDPRDSLKKLPTKSILVTPVRHKSISTKLDKLYSDMSARKNAAGSMFL